MPGDDEPELSPPSEEVPLGLDRLNLPNAITLSRLVLTVGIWVLIGFDQWIFAAIAFAVAVGTDYFDGYFARKYQSITVLGRILDPFADKIIICGTLIFLVAEGAETTGFAAWMVAVIIARELFVTMLRSFLEREGVDFSASWTGKWKMTLQSLAILISLGVCGIAAPSDATRYRLTVRVRSVETPFFAANAVAASAQLAVAPLLLRRTALPRRPWPWIPRLDTLRTDH